MKYAIGQTVYYIMDNRVCSSDVTSRMKVENAQDRWASTQEEKQSCTPFGFSRVQYATCHGILEEEKVFATKEDLLASL